MSEIVIAPMTDDELAEFLGIAGAKERDSIMARMTPERREMYEVMRRTEIEVDLWIKGLGPKPVNVIVCRGHNHDE